MSLRLRSLSEEDPSCDHVALDLGEPQLHLIEPGRIGRREVHMDRRMLGQESTDLFGLERREIVGNDVYLLASRLVGHDVIEESHELCRGMPCRSLAQHLTGLGIEGGVQGQRPMPEVFKPMAFSPPR